VAAVRRDGPGSGPPGPPGPPEQRPQLVPIQRLDVFRETLRRIDAHIEASGLGPGDRLPGDRELAATLGVSRPLVRQALKVLEGLGRLSAHQGSGTYVQDAAHRVAAREITRGVALDRDLLGEVLPVRIAIELEVARAAFDRRTPEMLAELRATLDERPGRSPEDAGAAGLDLGFEAALGRACGSELLRRLQALIHEVWLQAQIEVGVAPEGPDRLHREHRGVLAAFERGDLDQALDRLRRHLAFAPDG